MSLQYVLIPAVGVHEDTTGTMEDGSVIDQRISAHSAIHLLTSCDADHDARCSFQGPRFRYRRSVVPTTKGKRTPDWRLISSLHIELLIIACCWSFGKLSEGTCVFGATGRLLFLQRLAERVQIVTG